MFVRLGFVAEMARNPFARSSTWLERLGRVHLVLAQEIHRVRFLSGLIGLALVASRQLRIWARVEGRHENLHRLKPWLPLGLSKMACCRPELYEEDPMVSRSNQCAPLGERREDLSLSAPLVMLYGRGEAHLHQQLVMLPSRAS